MNRLAVVLLSGGLDSTTVAAMARAQGWRILALTIDYNQRHRIELEHAARVAEALGAERHIVLPLDLTGFGGSALTADIDVPKGGVEPGIPVTYVPARNTILLAVALGYAEVLNASDIFIGVNAVDYSGYPDCRDDTMKALQVTLNLGMDKRFVIDTPLMWLDKAATWQLAAETGGAELIDLIIEDSHTCYTGDRSVRHAWGYGCGRCPACVLRANGHEKYIEITRNIVGRRE